MFTFKVANAPMKSKKVLRRRRPRMTKEALMKNLLKRHGKEILEEEEEGESRDGGKDKNNNGE